jgi:hypothetical protein
MAAAQKLACVVGRIVDHGGQVYTITLRPERPVPRFRAASSCTWPSTRTIRPASGRSRVSSRSRAHPDERDVVRLTYAVHGRFTARMETRTEGRRARSGSSCPTATSSSTASGTSCSLPAAPACRRSQRTWTRCRHRRARVRLILGYGARTAPLLIYKDVARSRRGARDGSGRHLFVEDGPIPSSGSAIPATWLPGRVSVAALWPRVPRRAEDRLLHLGPSRDAQGHFRGPEGPRCFRRGDSY